jgi:hypothetical protein
MRTVLRRLPPCSGVQCPTNGAAKDEAPTAPADAVSSCLLDRFGSDPAMLEERAESDHALERRRGACPMLLEHGALSAIVTSEERTDQQAVVLIQLLQSGVGRAVQLGQALLAAAAEQGSIHG